MYGAMSSPIHLCRCTACFPFGSVSTDMESELSCCVDTLESASCTTSALAEQLKADWQPAGQIRTMHTMV